MEHTAHSLFYRLGPMSHRLTDDQIVRLTAEAGRIDARYPGEDDEYLRHAALNAAAMYVLGGITPEDARLDLIDAKRGERRSQAMSQQIGTMLANDRTMSEVKAAKAVGITRKTLREALGKG